MFPWETLRYEYYYAVKYSHNIIHEQNLVQLIFLKNNCSESLLSA